MRKPENPGKVKMTKKADTDKKKAVKPANSRKSAGKGNKNSGKFKPGKSGNPSGRELGSKNKRTLLLKELCTEKDFDPIEFLIDVAKNEEIEWGSRIKAACEVNACMNPKLKAVEHSGSIGKGDVKEMSEEELLTIANGDDN